jgi:glycosyltransferase involved in cell wall biosynthesis
MPIKLSIVIPTYNRRHVLERTLPTMLAQDFPPNQWEMVVVVDGGTDDTVDYLRALRPACELKILEQPNQGQAAASNAGAKIAAGELVLLMDDDILCDNTLVAGHVSAHENRPACVVFGNVLYSRDSYSNLASELARTYAEVNADRMARQGGPRSPFEVWLFSNCSMPRDLFVRAGGYDSNLTRAHDDELAIRLWKMRVPFHFEQGLVCHHFYTKTSRD